VARYTGPKARRWRRLGQVPPEGVAITVSRRNFPPGQHGLRRGAKLSEFGQQLHEKQKAKYTYGILERQFAGYYRKADKQTGVTGENLMRMLEVRLDNVVYRLGLAASRHQARQLVTHGHVRVNDRKVSIPSASVSVGDQVAFTEKYRVVAKEKIDLEALKQAPIPDWLQLNVKELSGSVLAEPARVEMDNTINEQLIVEYYSR